MLTYLLRTLPILMAMGLVHAKDCSTSGKWQDELKCRKVFQVEAASKFFSAEALTSELARMPEFAELGYSILRYTADTAESRKLHNDSPVERGYGDELMIRVTRKKLTTRFIVSIVDPVTTRVYVSEDSSSIGGEIEPKLAKTVMKWILEANGKTKAKN